MKIGDIVRAKYKVLYINYFNDIELDFLINKSGYIVYALPESTYRAKGLFKFDLDETDFYLVCGYTFRATGNYGYVSDYSREVYLKNQAYHKLWVLQRINKNNRYSSQILVDEKDILHD